MCPATLIKVLDAKICLLRFQQDSIGYLHNWRVLGTTPPFLPCINDEYNFISIAVCIILEISSVSNNIVGVTVKQYI